MYSRATTLGQGQVYNAGTLGLETIMLAPLVVVDLGFLGQNDQDRFVVFGIYPVSYPTIAL